MAEQVQGKPAPNLEKRVLEDLVAWADNFYIDQIDAEPGGQTAELQSLLHRARALIEGYR